MMHVIVIYCILFCFFTDLYGKNDFNHYKENIAIVSLEEFKGKLYAGIWNERNSCGIYRSHDGVKWQLIWEDGFGDIENKEIVGTGVLGDFLYLAMRNPKNGTKILRSHDGVMWQTVIKDGFGNKTNIDVTCFERFGRYFYAAVMNKVEGAALFRSQDGLNWSPVMEGGFGDVTNIEIRTLIHFKDRLIVGTMNSECRAGLYFSKDGLRWSKIDLDQEVGSVQTLTIFQDNLFLGCKGGAGGRGGGLWKSEDGINWQKINDPYSQDANYEIDYFKIVAYGNYIYTALRRRGPQGKEVTELWRFSEDLHWVPITQNGFDDENNKMIISLKIFKGGLYCGTWNEKTGCELWQVDLENLKYAQVNSDGFSQERR